MEILIFLFFPIIVVIAILIWAVATYNGFVRVRNLVQEAWRQIDVELHRRYDLIPNLLETVKGYAAHERAVFDEVTRARAQAASPGHTPATQAADENQLSQAIGRLFAVAEAYPELRASEQFAELQRELVNTEDRIAAGRRFYNGNVRSLNTKVESFPANIVANIFNFRRAEYFEVNDPSVRQAPTVSFGNQQGQTGGDAPTGHQPAPTPAAPSYGGQPGGYDPRRDGGQPQGQAYPPPQRPQAGYPQGPAPQTASPHAPHASAPQAPAHPAPQQPAPEQPGPEQPGPERSIPPAQSAPEQPAPEGDQQGPDEDGRFRPPPA